VLVPDAQAMEALGARLAAVPVERALIFLRGPLGAGKTTLARGFIRARGHGGSIRSPTYTLVESYEEGSGRIHHVDLYRLAGPADLEDLGLRDHLAEPAVVLVEWPERGRGWLPAADLELRIAMADAGREVAMAARGAAGAALERAAGGSPAG